LDVLSGVCLSVCPHDNYWTSKHRWWNFRGGGALYKNLSRVQIWGW